MSVCQNFKDVRFTNKNISNSSKDEKNVSVQTAVLCRERAHVSAANKTWLLLELFLFFRVTDQTVQAFLKVQSNFVLKIDNINLLDC